MRLGLPHDSSASVFSSRLTAAWCLMQVPGVQRGRHIVTSIGTRLPAGGRSPWDDAFAVDSVARFIGASLGAGDAAVVIATRPHLRDLEHRLSVRGLDLDIARLEGRYVTIDAEEALVSVMRDGLPDRRLVTELIGDVIAEATDGQRVPVRAFGEMVPILRDEGNEHAAARMQELWTELAATVPFERWDARR
jgi:hypothetical protein